MSSAITIGRWGDFLTRQFGIRGGSPQESLIPDVMPVAPLYDPTDVEHHWTRGEVLWSRGVSAAAGGAGTFATLEAKAGPGTLTVVEACFVSSSVAVQFQWNVQTRALTGASSPAYRLDARAETTAPPTVQIYAGVPGAAVTLQAGAVRIAAGGFGVIPIGVVIDNDDTFAIGVDTANVAVVFTLYGYDRLIDASEPRY